MARGKLYIVATPIGNLEDITLRAVDTLSKVEIVACEDTRRTSKLLDRIESRARLISFHKFSEAKKEEALLRELGAGVDVALVSDAGTPVISDPGHRLVAAARERGFHISIVPGPCSVVAAIALSGFDGSEFTFMGYTPRKAGQREKFFEEIIHSTRTLALFESPKRVGRFLEEACEYIPQRDMALIRELTKLHEEVIVGKPSRILEEISARDRLKGEVVIVIDQARDIDDPIDCEQAVKELMEQGYTGKRLADEAKKRFGLSKGEAYEKYLELKDNSHV